MSKLVRHKRATLPQLVVLCSLTPPTSAWVRWNKACLVEARLSIDGEPVNVSAVVVPVPEGQVFLDDEAAAEAKAHRVIAALRDPVLCGLWAEGGYDPLEEPLPQGNTTE